MSELIGSLAALSALRFAGEKVVRAVESLTSEGGSDPFSKVLAQDDRVKKPDVLGADGDIVSKTISEQVAGWLATLGLPSNEVLRFSLDSSGSPVLEHPPGHLVASDLRLRENEVLRQQLVDQIRLQPDEMLTIPLK